MTTTPDPIDVYVGARMRDRRRAMGKSQEWLAAPLRLSFQQIQKYERGANRVSASMLVHAAKVLGVAPGWFFEGLPVAITDRTADPAELLFQEWVTSPGGRPWCQAGLQLPAYALEPLMAVAQAFTAQANRELPARAKRQVA